MPTRFSWTPILIVQGGQWGSEGKGAVAARLCQVRSVKYAVRTGAINAGHTVVYKGNPYPMQQLPTGWVNRDTHLVIGPGAYVHPPTLFKEIKAINDAMPDLDVRSRLHIDYRCGLHRERYQVESAQSNRHHAIGATGKGCAEAIVDKIVSRNMGYQLFSQLGAADLGDMAADYEAIKPCLGDTVDLLNSAYDANKAILIEGTQGHHLDLHLGPYPYTTSRMTSAANWIAESGLSPALKYEIVMVVRTFPIRVAGNSGPMPQEIEWVDLAREINIRRAKGGLVPIISANALNIWEEALRRAAINRVVPINDDGKPSIRLSEWSPTERNHCREAASELHRDAFASITPGVKKELSSLFELTTVTRKLRRIARLDVPMLKESIKVDRPEWICLTFADYIEPLLGGLTHDQWVHRQSGEDHVSKAIHTMERYMDDLGDELGVPIQAFTTGPGPLHFIERDV